VRVGGRVRSSIGVRVGRRVLVGGGDRSAMGVRVGRAVLVGGGVRITGVRLGRGVLVGLGVRVLRGVGELVGVSVGVTDATPATPPPIAETRDSSSSRARMTWLVASSPARKTSCPRNARAVP
jgi:carbonic anhydrase/acetyltransferase-like protein (isoleucine patch superfamily)